MELKQKIREIKDFPQKGVCFKDITTLLKDGQAFQDSIKSLAKLVAEKKPDVIVGPEARGFIIGAPLAYELGIGFIPARKPGKLPYKTIEAQYKLEYGSDIIQMHVDAITPGQKVVIVDDLLATGGTIFSTIELIEKLQGEIVTIAFLIELAYLKGREDLSKYEVYSLIEY
ncbi:MAG TPA: adenine phosphoribosyltransferase [Thermoanaerobacterales bacterium]|nr:adenine phosphoribosyltransferase [Thermoanaerobacterales bacterium]